jgi:dimethylaniline monooxygenase (N-oxide forming)
VTVLAPGARVAVVGAGVSGLVTARVLGACGFDVTVFEKCDDVGGVWSASRSYPGISTQDDRRSYTFSDAAMPPHVDEHPSGADVRTYLQEYARSNGLDDVVRLGTEVLRAELVDGRAWEVEAEGPAGRTRERFDWLVAANGVFSTPHVPDWPGRDEFEAAGGAVAVPGELADGAVLAGRRAVVVGWGKTACDVAAAAVARGASVDVVARTLTWKYPKRVGRTRLTFRHLVLTRAGERLLAVPYRSMGGRVLLRRLPERIPRLLLDRALGRRIARATNLDALGLVPTMETRASTSLVTEGFFEAVADGRLRVHREASVKALRGGSDGPRVELTSGDVLPAELVVAATGYTQGVAFLAPEVVERARTEDGALLLHRRVLAVDVPRLAFVGWAHSYRSPVTSEVAALWLAGVMLGTVTLPTTAAQRRTAAPFRLERPEHHQGAGRPKEVLPGVTLRDLDRLLGELGVRLPRRTRLRQAWSPMDPSDYAPVTAALLRRAGSGATPVRPEASVA